MPVIGFRDAKDLKDYLVRATLPIPNESGRCEPCRQKTCLTCGSKSTATTFTTKASWEIFKIQSDPLNYDPATVLSIEVPYVATAKTKFRYRFDTYKSNIIKVHRAFIKGNRKVARKLFPNHYCLHGHSGIEDWDCVICEQRETHSHLKDREIFW